SFSHATIGVATKIDEYAPVIRPTNSASAKSCRPTAPRPKRPTTSSDTTGNTATNDVFNDRISTWLSDLFTIIEYVEPRCPARWSSFSFTLSKTTTVSYREN